LFVYEMAQNVDHVRFAAEVESTVKTTFINTGVLWRKNFSDNIQSLSGYALST